ncbi:MAG: hypothetical protein NVS2B14_04120 [Chamaesiphon sp.]
MDNLEARTGFLENHQFSTTTKLGGEAIFAVSQEFKNGNNTVLGDRVRLDLRSSFYGRDTLHTRLAAGNLAPNNSFAYPSATSTANTPGFFIPGRSGAEGTQTFNVAPSPFGNNIRLDWLSYYFPVGGSKIYLAAVGGVHSDYASTNNPYFEDYDGGNGSLSTFAQQNPIYRIGGGAGGAITLGVGKGNSFLGPTSISLGYLASNANNPGGFQNANGLTNGSYSALAQANFNLLNRIALGLTYVHSYHNGGTGTSQIFDSGGSSGEIGSHIPLVGTQLANDPRNIFGTAPILSGPGKGGLGALIGSPISANSYGASVAIRPSKFFSVSGFVGETSARYQGIGDGNVWYYGAGVALPNFGKPGNVLGLFAGVEPTLKGFRLAGNNINIGRVDNSYHFEGFYKYQLSDNISVTPGVIWLTNPGQDSTNKNAIIGTLRTTFSF